MVSIEFFNMLIVAMEYVIFETNMDHYTYVDLLPFLSIVDRGAYYLGGKETIRGGKSCCTYLSLVTFVVHTCRVVVYLIIVFALILSIDSTSRKNMAEALRRNKRLEALN
jgi:hypothetical protein